MRFGTSCRTYINITGLQVGFLFGGALFVEVVFAWPGIGYLIYSSIQARDYLTLQASVLIVSAVFVLVNLPPTWRGSRSIRGSVSDERDRIRR